MARTTTRTRFEVVFVPGATAQQRDYALQMAYYALGSHTADVYWNGGIRLTAILPDGADPKAVAEEMAAEARQYAMCDVITR